MVGQKVGQETVGLNYKEVGFTSIQGGKSSGKSFSAISRLLGC